jgi:hypothetical protein
MMTARDTDVLPQPRRGQVIGFLNAALQPYS